MNTNREYCKRIAKEIESYVNGEITDDDGETLSLCDWIDDVLDFEFVVDSQKNYVSAKIYVTLGGPTVWVDTVEKAVKLAWGADREEYPIAWDAVEQLNDLMIDIYSNL